MTLLRLTVLAVGLALAAPFASAQLIPSIGATAGVNFGSLSDVAGAELGNSTGFHVGIYADLGFGPLAVRPALLYLRAGDVEVNGAAASADFVTIPLDFKFQTPTPFIKGYAILGPEFRFPVGDDGNVVSTKSLNVAVNAGLGVAFDPPLVGPNGFLELRYALDTTGFAETLGVDDTSDTYKVSLFMIRAGFGL